MAIDPYVFSDKLAAWMAGLAGLEYAGTPRALWLGQAAEVVGAITDPYSVLSAYASTLQPVGLPSVSVQVKTVGEDAVAAAQAAALFNVLLVGGVPRQQVAIEGHKVIAFFNLRPPAPAGRDADKRLELAANFEVKYVAL